MLIKLASPRGFCAGVDRAIEIVERAIEKYGAPVYVRHEIVHNKTVVEDLKAKGAVFVDEIDEIPAGGVGIFSAHGVAKSVTQNAVERKLITIDATCPLVKKVHHAVARLDADGKNVVLIGHKGHPEVEGTMGQLAEGKVLLVESSEDVDDLQIGEGTQLAYTTQTTLSMYETQDVIQALRQKFPSIDGPEKGDLCYATTNRQQAVMELALSCSLILVIGSANSSNSNRLKELASERGVKAFLIDGRENIDFSWFEGIDTVGITSGASAPEKLVQEVIKTLLEKFPDSKVETVTVMEENVHFPLPRELS